MTRHSPVRNLLSNRMLNSRRKSRSGMFQHRVVLRVAKSSWKERGTSVAQKRARASCMKNASRVFVKPEVESPRWQVMVLSATSCFAMPTAKRITRARRTHRHPHNSEKGIYQFFRSSPSMCTIHSVSAFFTCHCVSGLFVCENTALPLILQVI